MEMIITSAKNPHIKKLQALQQKSAERREEGQRELLHCLEAGYELAEVYLCPKLYGEAKELQGWLRTDNKPAESGRSDKDAYDTFCVSPELYEKIAYRGTTEGIVAVVRSKKRTLADLHLPEKALIVVLESVEKPGNLGAILRSADAAGADAVIICDPLTDLYNPNLIRASIGAVFTVPCVACTSEECIDYLHQRGERLPVQWSRNQSRLLHFCA